MSLSYMIGLIGGASEQIAEMCALMQALVTYTVVIEGQMKTIKVHCM